MTPQKLFVEDDATRFQGQDSGHVTASDWWRKRTGRDLKDDLSASSIELSDFDCTSYLLNAYDPKHGTENVYLMSYSPDGTSISLCDDRDIVHIVRDYLFEYGDELYNAGRIIVSRTEAEKLGTSLEDFQPISSEQVWEQILTSVGKPPDLHLHIGEELQLSDREPVLVVEMSNVQSQDTAYETVSGFGSMAGMMRYESLVRKAAVEAETTVVCRRIPDLPLLDRGIYPTVELVNCNAISPAQIVEQLMVALGSVQQSATVSLTSQGVNDPTSTKLQRDAEGQVMEPYLQITFNLLQDAAKVHPDRCVTLPGERYDLRVDMSQPDVSGLEIYARGSTTPLVVYIPGKVLDVEEASLEDLRALNQGFESKFRSLQQAKDQSQER